MLKKFPLAAAFAVAFIGCANAQGQFPSGYIYGNSTALAGQGSPQPHSALLDRAFSSTRGAILERGASGWVAVLPSVTAGLPWVSNGTGSDPAYQLLGLSGGGTNNTLTANNGGIVWSDASKLNILAGTSTANQMLQSGATATPVWSTSTWPADVSASGQVLNSTAAHVWGATATPTVGVAGSTVGNLCMANATSGSICLAPATGALGSSVATVPIGTFTFAGLSLNQTFSGNNTFSGQAVHTGTSAPSSAAGNTVVMGTIAVPTLANTGQSWLYNTVANGAVLQGDGSSFDIVLANKGGTPACVVATGTTLLNCASLLAGSGSITTGATGAATGTVAFLGTTSGTATVTAQATAGSPTLTLPNTTGTFAVGATAPLALNTTTGNMSVTGAAGQVLAGSGPAFTATPTLGVAGSTVGSVAFANATSGTETIQPATGALGSGVATLPAGTYNLQTSSAIFTHIGYTATITQNTTVFMGTHGHETSDVLASNIMPTPVTISVMSCHTSSVGGSGQSVTFTLEKNGSDTAVTIPINTGNTANTDSSHSASYVAGDTFSVKTVLSATTGTLTGIACSLKASM